MLRSLGYFISDVAQWIRSRLRMPPRPGKRFGLGAAALAGATAVGVGAYFAVDAITDEPEAEPPAAAPAAVVTRVEASDDDAEPEDLGFPAFATQNTTRVSGADPVADAAAVALATFPSTGGVEGPAAVALVDVSEWPAAIAASVLMAPPVRSPMLFTDGGEVPELTASALATLAPDGGAETGGRQAFRIGAAADPGLVRTREVEGEDAATIAAAIDELRQDLTGSEPEHIVVASADEPAYAMPAAGWAALRGDPVLYAERDSVPEATLEALKRHEDTPAYVLGPREVISDKALRQIDRASNGARRVGGEDPVENAIAFARFSDGSFGWNINDPGHGLVLAAADRPADAGAAAPLSTSGTFGPLLLTDDAATLPPALRGYLLDLKPGYESDPTRAVYNHVWLMGDSRAVSVEVQAQVDELSALVQIGSGAGDEDDG